jgi:uncharacterized protein YndB with AHSA1/START domain
MPGIVRLHRVLKAPPARVYKAFTDGDAMAKWLPPNGFTAKVYAMDAKVGGKFRMSFTNFESGGEMFFHGEFLEMKPGEKLRYTDEFEDANLPGLITVTVLMKAVSCGTEIDITQEGIPDIIPEEMCYLGWQDSLRQLADLVETAAA